ncbi:uncharacterized protein V2V93DRAFT_373908 [Kockiozyma suomiensis]|uniref:uncharacterized protein n=1 Tax=Kockiozyma suomiensis TaxID=1337062 RepID=UPI003343ABD9
MSAKPVPVWVLSSKDETEASKRQAAFAREQCRSVLEAFTHCQSGRLLTTGWVCKEQKNDMMDCMLYYMQPRFRDQFVDQVIEEKKALKEAAKQVSTA